MEQFKISELEAMTLKYHAERVRAQQLATKLAQLELAAANKEQQDAINKVVVAYQPEGTRVTRLDPTTGIGVREEE